MHAVWKESAQRHVPHVPVLKSDYISSDSHRVALPPVVAVLSSRANSRSHYHLTGAFLSMVTPVSPAGRLGYQALRAHAAKGKNSSRPWIPPTHLSYSFAPILRMTIIPRPCQDGRVIPSIHKLLISTKLSQRTRTIRRRFRESQAPVDSNPNL